MQDIIFIALMMMAVEHALRKHGVGGIKGFFDFIALGMLSAMLICLVRIPIYLIFCGEKFPFDPSDSLQFISAGISIVFWWSMIYWRIPGRVCRFLIKMVRYEHNCN
jgi:hypothetical protein